MRTTDAGEPLHTLTRFPAGARDGADLLIEVPHGATETGHFDNVRQRLAGPFPDRLEQFFHVNTDVGAPECALSVARRLHERHGAAVWVLRSLIPRTFVDVNRVVSHGAGGKVEDGLTPGLPGYVRAPADVELLTGLHEAYGRAASEAFDTVCGRGGVGLIVHTYAPRSISIDTVDDDIVAALRDAYRPENLSRWPERPVVEVIDRTADGESLADEELIADLRARYSSAGVPLVENETYFLHAGTAGYDHSRRHPGRVLCIELNRGHLCDPWKPFEPSRVSPAAVERLTAPLAETLRGRLPKRSSGDG